MDFNSQTDQTVWQSQWLMAKGYFSMCQYYADLGLQPPGHVLLDEGASIEVGSIHYLQYIALNLTTVHVH